MSPFIIFFLAGAFFCFLGFASTVASLFLFRPPHLSLVTSLYADSARRSARISLTFFSGCLLPISASIWDPVLSASRPIAREPRIAKGFTARNRPARKLPIPCPPARRECRRTLVRRDRLDVHHLPGACSNPRASPYPCPGNVRRSSIYT